MKRLLLLRHAKSERETADDLKRGLEKRGEKDSVRMGRYLREDAYLPDLVLCSPSTRTRETLKRVLAELGSAPPVQYPSELYLAEPEIIASLARRAPEKCGTLMVVGHNPGLEQCALSLAAAGDDKAQRKRTMAMREKFPTCALAVIDFAVDRWADVAPGTGELDAFMRPKDLAD
ncbi:MAG: histidine phosphatase family protein [Alphaproteobacteria bacterium]|nr:histidine phosphatase family protein [Alphaproteobacteria bacterium]